jgi:hypothetical protein
MIGAAQETDKLHNHYPHPIDLLPPSPAPSPQAKLRKKVQLNFLAVLKMTFLAQRFQLLFLH